MRNAGIVGFSCATGLGNATWDFYRHLPFARWLVIPHPQLGVDEGRLDARCQIQKDPLGLVEEWLDGLDVLFSIEREFVPGLWRLAKQRGIRIVFMPNAEWFAPEYMPADLVDTFLAPTQNCAALLEECGFGGCTRYIPHPVDTTRFAFRERSRAELFVHFRGWGGYRERKGTGIVLRAARRCPEVHFAIRCQTPPRSAARAQIDLFGPTDTPEEQYTLGDVAIQPSRWEGVGLSILEAMACGLPTIVPDAPPMNEYPADAELLIPATGHPVMLGRPWTAWEMNCAALVETIRRLHGENIAELSRRARARMELRSWERLRPELMSALG
jgi:glycosyltransferase involved in cell wall biosynthesis